MIVWRGFGIVVGVIAVASLALVYYVSKLVGLPADPAIVPVLASILAALATYFFDRWLTAIGPVTATPSDDTFYGTPVKRWPFVFLIFAGMVVSVRSMTSLALWIVTAILKT